MKRADYFDKVNSEKEENGLCISFLFQIVANNWTKEADATDFVATDVEKWATGRDIQTYLYSRNNTVSIGPI